MHIFGMNNIREQTFATKAWKKLGGNEWDDIPVLEPYLSLVFRKQASAGLGDDRSHTAR